MLEQKIIFLTRDGCSRCRDLKPSIEKLAENDGVISMETRDVDSYESADYVNIAMKAGVRALPIIIFEAGNLRILVRNLLNIEEYYRDFKQKVDFKQNIDKSNEEE